MKLPMLWAVMAGFKRRADIAAGKTPEMERAAFENLKLIGQKTTLDNLPIAVQDFVKRMTGEAGRWGTN